MYKIDEELKTKVQMFNSTILVLQIFIFGLHYYGELLYIYCNEYQKKYHIELRVLYSGFT